MTQTPTFEITTHEIPASVFGHDIDSYVAAMAFELATVSGLTRSSDYFDVLRVLGFNAVCPTGITMCQLGDMHNENLGLFDAKSTKSFTDGVKQAVNLAHEGALL